MSLQILFLLVCSINLVISVPPLQLEDDAGTTHLFYKDSNLPDRSRALKYRLPTNIIPVNYTIDIRPILDETDANQFDAPGVVDIRVRCAEATNIITMHSITITIDEASVKVTDVATGLEIAVQGHEYNTDDETYSITLASILEEGQTFEIHIEYVAIVAEQLHGLYRSSYVNSQGVRRWLATTQFERIEARRVFPCFDEPALKATFDISIAYNQATGYHAICNMDIIEDVDIPDLPGWKLSTYRTSVIMPTYLIAIIVSDFIDEEAPPGSFGDKPVKTWGPPEMMNRNSSGAYSALHTARNLRFYEEYYAQEYVMPKMDSVAIPDFPFGAMENWGLITYSVNLLLYFEDETTESARRSISSVIAHEVGHQWFGNLLTMAHWNDVWLKEGFATYSERLAVTRSAPEFDSLGTGVIGSFQSAMEFDHGPNTLPVSNEGDQPGQIIYDKGSSLIRMVQAFLTEPTCQKGLRNYISEYRFGNVVQDDLFRHWNEAAQEDGNLPGLTVKEIMDTWTLQTGYPLIKVFKSSSNQITISQERFKYERLVTVIDPNEYWWVPITYTSAATPELPDYKPKLWMAKNEFVKEHTVDVNLDNDWIFVNPNGFSFYRVLYDNPLSSLIKAQLDREATVFTETSRSQLIDDYFTMAYKDYISIGRALDFTTYLAQEFSLAAWSPALKHLRTAYRLFSSNDDEFSLLQVYLSERLEGALALIGAEPPPGDVGVRVILRASLYDWACGMKTETCRVYAAKLYEEWIATPETNPIPVDLRSVMQCAGVSLGGVAEFGFAERQFENSEPNSANRQSWLNTIACSSDVSLLIQILAHAFESEDTLTKNEASAFFRRLAANSDTRDAAFEFLKNEVANIVAHLDGNVNIIRDLFQDFAQYFNRQEHITRMTDFVQNNSAIVSPILDSLNQHISTVRSNVNWMESYGNHMLTWLTNNIHQ